MKTKEEMAKEIYSFTTSESGEYITEYCVDAFIAGYESCESKYNANPDYVEEIEFRLSKALKALRWSLKGVEYFGRKDMIEECKRIRKEHNLGNEQESF